MTRRDVLDMFLLSAFWGVSFLMIKWAGQSFPPFWVAFMRSVIGAVVLLAVILTRREGLPGREHWPTLLWVALFSNAFPWLMFAVGELTVSSNIASILNATTPLFTLLISAGLGDARLNGRMALGVLVGLAGVALTVTGGVTGGQATLLGAVVILSASLSYGVGGNYAKRKVTGLAPLSVAASQMIASALWLSPFVALGPHPTAINGQAWAGVLIMGAFGSGLAYLLYYRLLANISPTQTTAVTYILPIWGLFWGALAGERVALASLLGVAIILAGLILLNWPAGGRRAVQPGRT